MQGGRELGSPRADLVIAGPVGDLIGARPTRSNRSHPGAGGVPALSRFRPSRSFVGSAQIDVRLAQWQGDVGGFSAAPQSPGTADRRGKHVNTRWLRWRAGGFKPRRSGRYALALSPREAELSVVGSHSSTLAWGTARRLYPTRGALDLREGFQAACSGKGEIHPQSRPPVLGQPGSGGAAAQSEAGRSAAWPAPLTGTAT